VNEKKDGKQPRCAICGKTAQESAAQRIRELGLTGADAARWKSFRLEADHKYPSSKIKKAPGFAQLESKNLDAAKRVMHLQSNIRGLCKPCNASLQDKSGFQGTAVKDMIQRLLTAK
jgi:hypothetical protein